MIYIFTISISIILAIIILIGRLYIRDRKKIKIAQKIYNEFLINNVYTEQDDFTRMIKLIKTNIALIEVLEINNIFLKIDKNGGI